jgi:hypothetical protein
MGWALPLRRWRGFVYRRSALRFSDIWVERGHASIDAFYLPCSSTPLQSITAATSHRVPVPILGLTGVCAGQNTGGDQGAAAHPASGPPCGWGPDHRAGRCEQARHSGPEGGPDRSASSLARRSRPRPGADCLFLPAVRRERRDGRANGDELRHLAGKPVGGTRAPGGSHRSLGGTSSRAPSGVSRRGPVGVTRPQAAGQRGQAAIAESPRRLPRAGNPNRSWGPGRKTRSGNTMTPPMGFVSFRREEHR